MFITKNNLKRILREIGLEIGVNGYICQEGNLYHSLLHRIAELERLERNNHEDIPTLTHKFNKLLDYLKLEYQNKCKENLPKIVKKKS